MHGVLIASANVDVRKSLVAILQSGRTVYECRCISECLALASAQKFDSVFIDDVFEDGRAEELARGLSRLGYGGEIIPILLTDEPLHVRTFDGYGVRHVLLKPFDVQKVERIMARIEEESDLQELSRRFIESDRPTDETPPAKPASRQNGEWQLGQEVDVREISQRFRRLVRKVASRDELIAAFADCMREQFDIDNVVLLLPSEHSPDLRLAVGQVAPEIQQQFYVPLNEPLLAALIRLGEPVWVHDCDRLGRQNALTALRYGERLNIHVLAPVLSRGRLIGLVGLSRFHRYEHSPYLVSLLRLFLSFFSEALENTQLYEKASAAGEVYRNVLEAMPAGTVGVCPDGRIVYANSASDPFLAASPDTVEGELVERVGSRFADVARECLQEGAPVERPNLQLPGGAARVRAVPLPMAKGVGALIVMERYAPAPPVDEPTRSVDRLKTEDIWQSVASVIAHNFKNALVPVKTCAELLPERYESAAFRNSFFEVVNDNVRRLDGWIEQLLRYAHVQASRGDWSACRLHTCIETAADEVSKAHSAVHVEFRRNWAQNDTVRGNPEYLQQAFAALIQNALDAVQDIPSPVITLRTEVIGECVRATVGDNGRGLDDEARHNAFSAFATTKLSGLGLGLAYVQRIAEVHEATVDLVSDADTGTTVELSFPLHQPAPVH